MFTGIIEEVGTVRAAGPGRLTVSSSKVLEGTEPGDSIAVNGACLTVTSLDRGTFSVSVMPETMRRTNLGRLGSGQPVNLERALPANGRFGGHFVQGHVDGTGRVIAMMPEGQAVAMKVAAPPEIMQYVVEKGFIAVDGASLTVTAHDEKSFAVSLVEFTRENTTLGFKKVGDVVNLEVDIIAKYVERIERRSRPGVSMEMLGEHGFLAT